PRFTSSAGEGDECRRRFPVRKRRHYTQTRLGVAMTCTTPGFARRPQLAVWWGGQLAREHRVGVVRELAEVAERPVVKDDQARKRRHLVLLGERAVTVEVH